MRDIQSDFDQYGFTYVGLYASFSFNPENKQFEVGSGPNEGCFNLNSVNSIFDLTRKVREDVGPTTSHPLLLSIGSHLVETPAMRSYLMNKFSTDKISISERVEEVMKEVYMDLKPGIKIPKKKKRGDELWMGITVQISESGTFSLQTFGNCACLNPMPDPDSVIYVQRAGYRENPGMPVEYWLHNTDTKAEMVSLYAGAGTMAWLSKKEG